MWIYAKKILMRCFQIAKLSSAETQLKRIETRKLRFPNWVADVNKWKKNTSIANTGKQCPEETKRLSSIFNTGHAPPNKGKTYEESYGKEKAKQLKKQISVVQNGCCRSAAFCNKISMATRGEKNPAWKGGVCVNRDGEKSIWTSDGHIKEYRLIMMKKLNRKLNSDEHVHHIDGNHANNAIENLCVCSRAEHGAIHGSQRWTKPAKRSD